MKLIQDPESHKKVGAFTGYTLGKNEFIKDVMLQMGFDGICPRFCTHYAEWDEYHRIREQLITKAKGAYTREDSVCSSAANHHLVFYRGTEIIGASHIDASNDSKLVVKFFHVEDLSFDQTLTRYLKEFLRKWGAFRERALEWEE